MTREHLTFGILCSANASFDTQIRRWRLIEALGFDQIWISDHIAGFAMAGEPYHDGWTTLAALAANTATVRVGSLVSNQILRPPAVLAKQALAVDNLSRGRLELGIGAGIAEADHAAVGEPYWKPHERVERLAEYVRIVEQVTRGGPVSFDGSYLTSVIDRSPAPVQYPRPPITIGGQSPSLLRIVAELADGWNTHGPPGATVEEIARLTEEQMRRLDRLCESFDRDPRSVRRSIVGVQALDIWANPLPVAELVERFANLGFTGFILRWPGDDRQRDVEALADAVLATR